MLRRRSLWLTGTVTPPSLSLTLGTDAPGDFPSLCWVRSVGPPPPAIFVTVPTSVDGLLCSLRVAGLNTGIFTLRNLLDFESSCISFTVTLNITNVNIDPLDFPQTMLYDIQVIVVNAVR